MEEARSQDMKDLGKVTLKVASPLELRWISRSLNNGYFFFSLWLYLRHMEVPRPGIKSKSQMRPVPELWQGQNLNHCTRLGIELVPLQRQNRVFNCCATRELLRFYFNNENAVSFWCLLFSSFWPHCPLFPRLTSVTVWSSGFLRTLIEWLHLCLAS